MIKKLNTQLNGVFEIISPLLKDNRGFFLKHYNSSFFKDNLLNVDWKEEYFSASNKNVIRGMHFQVPPYSVEKLVTCLTGSVIDVIIDLRPKSSTYLKIYSTKLTGSEPRSIYIPKGCAHGFISLEDNSIMHYMVSEEYNYSCDKGVLWSSIGFDWPRDANTVVSERDKLHPELDSFLTPF
jgi:dTDP-4-dehydrorhamnose 3,5-epimerase